MPSAAESVPTSVALTVAASSAATPASLTRTRRASPRSLLAASSSETAVLAAPMSEARPSAENCASSVLEGASSSVRLKVSSVCSLVAWAFAMAWPLATATGCEPGGSLTSSCAAPGQMKPEAGHASGSAEPLAA